LQEFVSGYDQVDVVWGSKRGLERMLHCCRREKLLHDCVQRHVEGLIGKLAKADAQSCQVVCNLGHPSMGTCVDRLANNRMARVLKQLQLTTKKEVGDTDH
jgi:hypothetical protein